MEKSRCSIVCTLTLASALLSLPNPTYSSQARSSAVTDWTKPCEGDSRGWWEDMCQAWRTQLGTKGWTQWWANYEKVTVSRYADSSLKSWGYDNTANGFDSGTASLLCTHGGYDNVGWWGLMQHPEHKLCGIYVDQMSVGKLTGGSTRYLHLSSCNSMRWDKTSAWFGPAKGGVHLITGFHGIMYIGSAYVSEYKNMVNDSITGTSIADSWVNDMHHDPVVGPTICPISMSFGATKEAALNRLYSEKYSMQSEDTANAYGVLMWIAGCHPDDGDALPK